MSKKKILLLSDDLRMSSGVGTVSKNFVLGTIDKYDWVQAAGAIKHPEEGKVVDMNDSIRKETGIKDASLKIYPISGYGNQELLRQLMNIEKPDAILHYTDPRFWVWLYQMEHEIRRNIPIFYYNIWDDLPYPRYNEFFYESSDLIMNISKQTHNIVNNCAVKKPRTEWDNTYVPHGIPESKFHPITELEVKDWEELQRFRKEVLHNKDKDFIVFWNNRNIRRKVPSDVILAYKTFCDGLTKEQSQKCVLVMHTAPIDNNGTDLPEVVNQICPDYDVIFSNKKLEEKQLNFLYNVADVQINMASNEGFGLGTAEAVMSGTPIIVNVTGGLQDQCGFKLKGKYVTYKDYSEIISFHDDRKWKDNPDLTHGEWVKPVWPSNRSLQGSIPTPYIFDDRCRWDDVADRLKEWYDTPKEERTEAGLKGREWMLSEEIGMSAKHMCDRFVHDMDKAFKKWTPRKRFTLHKVV
jgi:glycosyltransferase involved in cell wall biosynthesis|tara:strand:+ start:4158 stop:5555 length:1398 start_codon:yes stop_codon:yes gene_type:complete